ncbi:MAG: divergent polysaccharide deacetylase family protein [bacterium]|nr:divergent polysaccharide deacetylase family protein [bacterium]
MPTELFSAREKRSVSVLSEVNYGKLAEEISSCLNRESVANEVKLCKDRAYETGICVDIFIKPSEDSSIKRIKSGLKNIFNVSNIKIYAAKDAECADKTACFEKYIIRVKGKSAGMLRFNRVYSGYITIIIDDFGNSLDYFYLVEKIKEPINCAVLPHLRYSEESAVKLHSMGFEVMLHCPMEPESKAIDAGKGMLFCGMDRREAEKLLKKNIDSVPFCAGINNHMGSKVCASKELVETVLKQADRAGLFFVDSLTSGNSVMSQVAEEVGCAFMERDIFLDNIKEDEAIKSSFEDLIKLSKKNGKAVAIGHYREQTLRILISYLDVIKYNNLKIVPASQMVNIKVEK